MADKKFILINKEAETLESVEFIHFDLWGKDHFSTMTFLEYCAVENQGAVDRRRMRTDGEKYPSMLKDGLKAMFHDDYDCALDLERFGLIIFSTHKVELTVTGFDVAHSIRQFKAKGGNFVDFEIPNGLKRRMQTFFDKQEANNG